MALFLSRVLRRHASRLVYGEYGVPSEVVRIETFPDPEISGPTDVVVKMLAAPIHPADINTIQGKLIFKLVQIM
jgi:NADPH:quinone reductase-like Zn-dependent oxidoreductase